MPATAEADDDGPLEIPTDILAAMVDHCRRDAPLECCGFLAGPPRRVTAVYPLRNALASPTRYLAHDRDLIHGLLYLRVRRDLCLLAIYHSHPKWPAVPSQTDIDQNYYGEIPRIIVSLLGDRPDVRIWRLDTAPPQEVDWRLVDVPHAPLGVEPWDAID